MAAAGGNDGQAALRALVLVQRYKACLQVPDYAYIHKELQRSGVTLNLLWMEYRDQYRASGEIPYQSTQFDKYYADYRAKTNATMHFNYKPGEIMQVDWSGDTASVVDTDTGEVIPAYVFVASRYNILALSGDANPPFYQSRYNQSDFTTAHKRVSA